MVSVVNTRPLSTIATAAATIVSRAPNGMVRADGSASEASVTAAATTSSRSSSGLRWVCAYELVTICVRAKPPPFERCLFRLARGVRQPREIREQHNGRNHHEPEAAFAQ